MPQDPARCVDDQRLGSAYTYLLGLYLGDGMLSQARRDVWRIRITLDARYPDIIRRAKAAMNEVADRVVGDVARPGCREINSYWKHWICLFPQHGQGAKHTRHVTLAEWQQGLISRFPGDFLAGLIHSDGCRCVNRVKGHEYPRYFFSNLSAEIREMFISACTLVGVDCRPDGSRNVSVARRDSVAIRDLLVGPKR